MVLVSTDGNTVLSKSTGIGGARVPGLPDGVAGTRNTPIIGFTAPSSGQYFLAVYDYHIEGGGPVPITLEVNTRRPVLCADRTDSNCVERYPDQCVDQSNWVILPDVRLSASQSLSVSLCRSLRLSASIMCTVYTLDIGRGGAGVHQLTATTLSATAGVSRTAVLVSTMNQPSGCPVCVPVCVPVCARVRMCACPSSLSTISTFA